MASPAASVGMSSSWLLECSLQSSLESSPAHRSGHTGEPTQKTHKRCSRNTPTQHVGETHTPQGCSRRTAVYGDTGAMHAARMRNSSTQEALTRMHFQRECAEGPTQLSPHVHKRCTLTTPAQHVCVTHTPQAVRDEQLCKRSQRLRCCRAPAQQQHTCKHSLECALSVSVHPCTLPDVPGGRERPQQPPGD